jgi:autotransporter-associated beta strand protein
MSMHLRKLRAGAVFLIALLVVRPSGAQVTYTWTATGSGSFGTATNCAGPPTPTGGDSSGTLVFGGSGVVNYTATNNQGNPFHIADLTFGSMSVNTITLASATSNIIELDGAATITQAGPGNVSVTSPLTIAGALTLTGDPTAGLGTVSLVGAIGGSGGLVVGGTGPTVTTQVFSLSSTNTFTGGVTLNSGNLRFSGANSFGPAGSTLTINGGTLQTITAGSGLAANVVLNADLPLLGTGSVTVPSTSVISGSGGLRVLDQAAWTIQSSSTYAGATVVDLGTQPTSQAPATLTFSGAAGSATNSASVSVGFGGSVALDNSSAANSNRIGDTTPINLRGGNFNLFGNGTTVVNEVVGPLTGAGQSVVTVTPTGTTTNVRLAAASLNQADYGTFLFRGTNLGATASGGNGNIRFATPPALTGGGGAAGSTTMSIIPYAVGDTTANGTGSGFVTYDVGPDGMAGTADDRGVRLLAANEYATTIAQAQANTAVNLQPTFLALSGSLTVNSLSLASGFGASVVGSGTVHVTSGALLFGGFSSVASTVVIDFGTAHGYFMSPSSLFASFQGTFHGTNGLSIAGADGLILAGDNSGLTGPLALNNGVIIVSAPNQIPGSGPIIINAVGGNSSDSFASAGLSYAAPAGGLSAITVGRDIVANGGMATLAAGNGSSRLTLSGTISGPGGVISNSPGTVVLTGANTYTGPTVLVSVTAVINADSAFGNGGALELATGATVQLNGDWTTSRPIVINNSGTVNTNGHSASWAGVTSNLLSSAVFTKAGPGSLTIASPSPYAGTVTVATNGDTFRLAGTGALLSRTYNIGLNGALVIDNSSLPGMTVPDRVNDAATVTLNGGTVSLIGNAGRPVTEAIGSLVPVGGGNVVMVSAPAGSAATLSFSSYPATPSGTTLFRGADLGGASRIYLPATPGSFLSNALAEDLNAPGVVDLAYYDATVGVRMSLPSDYTSAAVIQNPANGGTTPTSANVRAGPGVVPTVGAANTIATLRIAPGGSVDASAGVLTVSTGNVFTEAGSPTTITGGTLNAGPAPLHAVTNADLTIGSGLTGSGGFAKSGSGTLTLTGAYAVTGPLNIDGGLLNTNGADVSVGTLGGAGGTLAIGPTASLTVTQAANCTFGSTLSGGVNFTKAGSATLTLAPTTPLAYSGTTTIAQGTLSLVGNNVLPTGSPIIIGSPAGDSTASLVLNGYNQAVPGLTFISPTAQNTKAVDVGGGTLTLNGNLSVVANTTTPGAGQAVTITGTTGGIDLAGGVRTISVQGTGSSNGDLIIAVPIANGGLVINGTPSTANGSPAVVTLSGANTYIGGTVVASGTLKFGSSGGLAPGGDLKLGTANSAVTGTVNLNGSAITVNSINLSAGNTGGAGNVITDANNGELIVRSDTTDSVFGGQLTGNPFLFKLGAARFVFPAGVTQTYTGSTSASGGVFQVDGVLGTSTSSVSVSSSTIAGTGTINRPVSVSSGTLAPGDSGPGVLSITKALTMTFGTFAVDLDGNATAGLQYDQLNLTGGGTLSLSNSNIAFTLAFDPTSNGGAAVPIIVGGTITGTFINAPAGQLVDLGTFNGQDYEGMVNYNGTSVNLSNFQAVPEPTYGVFLALGAAGYAVRRWRRRLP